MSLHGKYPPIRAFTLIELLAVIAIVLILGALVFPAFMSLRESSDHARCVSNLRNIGTLWHIYVQDKDGMSPPMNQGTGAATRTWRYFLMETYTGPIEGGPNLAERRKAETARMAYPFWCPTYLRLYPKEDHPAARGSYSLNQYFREQRRVLAPTDEFVGRLEPLVAESMPRNNTPEEGSVPPLNSLRSGNRQGGAGNYHKRSEINALFLNGHVRRLTLDEQKELSPLVENLDDFL
jgi:prepilin-type N-terminal cleavage/methylation domain-containing protein